YLFRHALGRKQGARMSVGHFIVCLGVHFGVITKEILHALTVKVRELTTIDIDELVRLRIWDKLRDVVTWVPMGPERQHVEVAARAVDVDPRLRLEEEVHEFGGILGEQRQLLEKTSSDHDRLSTGMVARMTQLMDQSGMGYMRFDGTYVESLHVEYE
nr:hypothetical protein [Tanacetum cinerariifolium]